MQLLYSKTPAWWKPYLTNSSMNCPVPLNKGSFIGYGISGNFNESKIQRFNLKIEYQFYFSKKYF